ncbi:hypothetical protein D3C84_1186070 [compost metagenome]
MQNAEGINADGYAHGFMVCGAVLVSAGLIGLLTMNPQRSRNQLHTTTSAQRLQTS